MLESSPNHYPEAVSPSGDSPETELLTVAQAIANLSHPDLSLRYYAAWWLGEFGGGVHDSVDVLIAALDDEADRTELGGYPLRRNAARALGKLADCRAVPALIRCLDCSDFYVREAAAQSLGQLGDPACIPALMKLLEGGVAAAQLVPGRPHLAQPARAVMEALEMLRATAAIPLIQPFLDHSVDRVQHAAARAMYVLTQEPAYGERLLQALGDSDLKMCRSILLDLGASGYLPAAEVIAHAAVENSFKMIALKGLLEKQFRQPEQASLSQSAQQVMALMDILL